MRAGRIFLSLLVCGLLIYRLSIVEFAAAMAQAGQPALALDMAPNSAPALSALAAERLASGAFPEAASLGRRALARAPIDVRAARTLGLAAIAQGRPAEGLALMNLAGQLGWRDGPTQMWLMQAALSGRDYRSAMQRADALLRQHVATDYMFSVVRGIGADPQGRDAIIDRLAGKPDWRHLYFMNLKGLMPQDYDGHEALLARMARRGIPASRDEVANYVRLLTQKAEFERAYAVWTAYGPPDRHGALLRDGDFSQAMKQQGVRDAPSPVAFEWSFPDLPGASAIVEAAGNGNGYRLSLRSDGATDGALASQILLLKPGRYSLSFALASQDVEAPGVFNWWLLCFPASGLAPMLPVSTVGKGRSQLEFAIPPSGCAVQSLRLHVQRIAAPKDVSAILAAPEIHRNGYIADDN